MTSRLLTNLGLEFDWDLGADGWKSGMDRNLLLLDTLAQPRAIDVGRNAPPGAPESGDTYVVGASPSGAWSGGAWSIAVYDADEWVQITPREGWQIKSLSDGLLYEFNGSEWAEVRLGGPLANLTAAAPPTIDDDETQGYEPLSVWIDISNGEYYKCLDATAGAAVWVKSSLTIDELGALALANDASGVPYSGSAPGSDVAAALNALHAQTAEQPVIRQGAVTISPSSDTWQRTDFENVSLSPALPDGNYRVLFEYPNDAAAQSIGNFIAYDKAGNGFKVRATGSAGGTVLWSAIQLP